MALSRSSKAGVAVFLLAIGVVAVITVLAQKQHGSVPSPPTKKDKTKAIGWVAVVSAVVVFGSFGILMKAESVVAAKPDPVVFQTYIAYGVACSSVLVLTFTDATFSWWGVLGAGMWWCNSLCTFVAVRNVGYALGPAIWAGMTIVVSFLWGTLLFHEDVKHLGAAIAGIVVLVAGIGLAAFAESLSVGSLAKSDELFGTDLAPGDDDLELYQPLRDADGGRHGHYDGRGGGLGAGVRSGGGGSNSDVTGDGNDGGDGGPPNRTVGFVSVALVGAINGSLMVPFTEFSKSQPSTSGSAAIAYLYAFSVGIACLSPVFLVVYHLALCRKPRMHFSAVSVPGFITGFLWAVGNYASCYATQYLGSTIGYPLTQTCIIFSGIWGIAFYKEMRGFKSIGTFSLAVLVILAGSALLAVFG